ncbi:MAG: hypothetical protein U1E62_01455 [Alsobacter sp.]
MNPAPSRPGRIKGGKGSPRRPRPPASPVAAEIGLPLVGADPALCARLTAAFAAFAEGVPAVPARQLVTLINEVAMLLDLSETQEWDLLVAVARKRALRPDCEERRA